MIVYLSFEEMSNLFSQDPSTESKGGFQSLLVRLQKKTNKLTGEICLSNDDISDIIRYSKAYGSGGWEKTLKRIFGRTLSI